MGSITRSHSFVSGEKPTESEWNVDIDQLFTLVNGQLDTNNVDTSSSDGVSVLNANQTITGTRTHSGTVTMADDIDLIFGTNSDIKIQYDEGTDDALLIDTGVEGAALAVVLKADQGDDAGDAWKLNVADGGVVTLGNDIASKGSYVTQLTLTPNSTVASSTTAIAGHATVGGNLTVTGGVTVAGASAFDIGDSDKLLLGDSDDLQVYHDGSNSYIANATGALKIATETSGIAVTIGHTTSETTIADNATVTGTLAAGASTLASLTCTAAATFGGGTGSSGATITTAGAGTFDGILKTEDTTAATNTTDGSLQTDGGLSVALDAVVGDDIILLSDSSVIHFGADSDVTLTHAADVGLTLGGAGSGTLLKIDNTATDGDSAIQFALSGTVAYTMGVEDGDSDKFVINYGTGVLGAQPALEIDSSGNTALAGTVNLGTVAAAGTDTDKFLVLDSSGNVDYRTGAQVLSDIGAGSAATSGDFSGPGSSTDNAIVRFDGTGGKTGQTSSVLIDDSNNVSGIGTLSAGATTVTSLNVSDGSITNVNDIAVDTISGDADANTTIGFPGSDVLTLSTGGTERLRISSAGSLSLGATAVGGSPGAGSVEFQKDADNYVRFWDNATATFYMQSNAANAPTTAFKNSDSDSLDITTFQRTNAGGNLYGQSRNGLMLVSGAPNGVMAVGTSNAKNLVLGTNNTAAVTIDSSQQVGIGTSSVATGAVLHVAHGNTSNTNPELLVKSTLTGNANSHTRAQIESGGGDAALTLYDKSNYWTMAVDQSNSSRLDIGTGQWVSPKLTILTGGKVGINITDPEDYSDASGTTLVVGNTSGTTTRSGVSIITDTSGIGRLAFGDGAGDPDQWKGLIQYTQSSDTMGFACNGQAVEMSLVGGDLGIGTASPGARLEISDTTAPQLLVHGTSGNVTGTSIDSYMESSSPADNDFAGAYGVYYKDDGGTKVQVGSSGWFVTDVSAGTIDSYFYLRVYSNNSAVAGTLSSSGVWTDSSAAANKKYYGTRQEVWPDGVLPKLKTLRVSKYKQADLPDDKPVTETHVSPTAEDFWDAFQIGQDPRREVLNAEGEQILNPSIAPKDLSGVALVAIQELLDRVEAAEVKIAALEAV